MKLIKKSLSFITAIACCAAISSIMPFSSSAEESVKTYGDLSYITLDSDGDGTDDYAQIVDCNETAVEVDIPAEIEGLPVKSTRDWAFADCKSLTSISVPDSVNAIGNGAFSGCSSLASINIPNSVTTIRGSAFCNCLSLTSITIPESVTSIIEGAFAYCSNLITVKIPDSVTDITDKTFYVCSSLTSVTIPDSVTHIGYNAFKYCKNLTSIIIKNPNCEISNGKNTIWETATIYGYENSTAQAYAETYDRKFVLLIEYTETILGDISGNGKIDLYDAIEIAKAIMGLRTFTDEEMIIADFNMDGTVDLYDAIEIARTLLPK